MLGSIAGDIIGAPFEFDGIKTTDFPLFSPSSDYTDDTVLTIAVAKVILDGGEYATTLRDFGRRYPGRGYGGMFARWLRDGSMGAYNSFGNGSAMRASPVGFAAESPDWALAEAERSAAVTHSHPAGIKGAQAVALAIFQARHGSAKENIREELTRRFGYDLSRPLDVIRPGYRFNETCPGSVPEAIIAFLESTDFEDCLRKAVSLGGDADTQACIAGGIAQALYGGVPSEIARPVRRLLPAEFIEILDRFGERFGC